MASYPAWWARCPCRRPWLLPPSWTWWRRRAVFPGRIHPPPPGMPDERGSRPGGTWKAPQSTLKRHTTNWLKHIRVKVWSYQEITNAKNAVAYPFHLSTFLVFALTWCEVYTAVNPAPRHNGLTYTCNIKRHQETEKSNILSHVFNIINHFSFSLDMKLTHEINCTISNDNAWGVHNRLVWKHLNK